jgi:DNA-binding LytR/AlgR family response regulator
MTEINLKPSHTSTNHVAKVLSISGRKNSPFSDKFIVPGSGEILILKPEEINYLKAMGNYTMVYYGKGQSKLLSKCLKTVMENLDIGRFVRIHQSYVVPADRIRLITSNSVVLHDQVKLPFSRRFRKRLLAQLQK